MTGTGNGADAAVAVHVTGCSTIMAPAKEGEQWETEQAY